MTAGKFPIDAVTPVAVIVYYWTHMCENEAKNTGQRPLCDYIHNKGLLRDIEEIQQLVM